MNVQQSALAVVSNFLYTPDKTSASPRNRLFIYYLQNAVIVVTNFSILAWEVLCSSVKKEAATSSMSLTLFDCARPFPNGRSGWWNGILHSLS